MTTTSKINLHVPVFDQIPWDTDVNDNWYILDAVVGLFSTVPSMVGVWKNVTAYAVHDVTVDLTEGSMWGCLVNHTSSASPIDFANERAIYPGRWSRITSGVQFYADAAAASAADAAASAADAASKLSLSGGTIDGTLTVHGPIVSTGTVTVVQLQGNTLAATVANLATLQVDNKLLTSSVTATGTILGSVLQGDTLVATTGNINEFGVDTLLQAATVEVSGKLTAGTIVTGGVMQASAFAATQADIGVLGVEGLLQAGTIIVGNIISTSGTSSLHIMVADTAEATILGGATIVSSGNITTTVGTITAAAFATISDARHKFVVGSYDGGLEEVVQLSPVRYHHHGGGEMSIGVVAQEAERVIPEMVHKQGINDLRTVDSGVVLWALVNAVKEISERLERLEAPHADSSARDR